MYSPLLLTASTLTSIVEEYLSLFGEARLLYLWTALALMLIVRTWTFLGFLCSTADQYTASETNIQKANPECAAHFDATIFETRFLYEQKP